MTVNFRRLLTAFTIFLAINLTSLLYAQFNSTLEGVVQDTSGGVIPSAAVELRNLGTSVVKTTTTDSAGYYRFVSLAPGQYHVKVTHTGFNEGVAELTLLTAQLMNLPITLTVSAQRQTVEVTAQVPVVDTSDSRTQATLERMALGDLPLQGRNLMSLTAVAPGVEGLGEMGSVGSPPDNFNSELWVDASANGRSYVGNMYVVDGLDITSNIRPGVLNLTPNPDSIQEASVQVNTFDAAYGRASSIEMVMTTKSGTSQFHGNASDYFTYQGLWAGTEFVHSYAPFHTTNASGTVGGPISKKYRAYFFFSIEPLRGISSTGNSSQTFEDRQFTAWAQQNFPNTIGTQILTQNPPSNGTVTGVSLTAADIFPGTCGTSATANIPCNLPMVDNGYFNSTNWRHAYQFNIRGDKYWDKDRIYANFYRTSLNTGGGTIRPGFATTSPYYTKTLQANETHTFSPTLLNELAFGADRVEGIGNKTGKFDVPTISVVAGGFGLGDGFADGDYIQTNYHWRDVLTSMRGTHILKFGYEGWHGLDLALFAPCYEEPSFTFENLLDLVRDNAYSESSLSYSPLTGKPLLADYDYLMTTHGAFAEDTWKVRPNITLNYGLRWDEFGNPYGLAGPGYQSPLSNFYLGPGATRDEQIANGSLINKGTVYAHHIQAFSPRVGLAWDPTGKAKWVVRGGFGVFHDWPTLGNDENDIRGNPPGYVVPVFLRGTTTAPVFGLGTSNSPPFGYPYPPFVTIGLDSHGGLAGEQVPIGAIDPFLSPPDTFNYTGTLQRQLGRHLALSAGYSGSHSIDLLTGSGAVGATSYGFDINRFPGDLIVNLNHLTRLNHSFGSITYATSDAKATYNALIVSLQGKFSDRGFINLSYTRSSSYDNVQVYPTTDNTQYWGPSPWDAPNRLAFTESYILPGLKNPNPALHHLSHGWELSSTTILQSGLPYSVYTGAPFEPIFNAAGTAVIGMQPGSGDYNADGYDYDFPNAPSFGYKTPTSRKAYLSGLYTAADFPVPAMGTEGNEKFNGYRGPGFAETDFALLKNDRITERVNLQLRFEFYNVFNRPNLIGVDANLPDSTFGRSTSQYNPRWMQFGINLKF